MKIRQKTIGVINLKNFRLHYSEHAFAPRGAIRFQLPEE